MNKKQPSYAMSPVRWANMLYRWSETPDSGEKKLVAWAIGQWIFEGAKEQEPFSSAFFDPAGNFNAYCKLISLDPIFVREQIERARHKEMGPHQPCFFAEAGRADREAMR